MRRSLHSLICIALGVIMTLCAFGCAPAQFVDLPVTGRTINPHGQPIAHATVKMFMASPHKLIATQTTNRDGRFTFTATKKWGVFIAGEDYWFPRYIVQASFRGEKQQSTPFVRTRIHLLGLGELSDLSVGDLQIPSARHAESTASHSSLAIPAQTQP